MHNPRARALKIKINELKSYLAEKNIPRKLKLEAQVRLISLI